MTENIIIDVESIKMAKPECVDISEKHKRILEMPCFNECIKVLHVPRKTYNFKKQNPVKHFLNPDKVIREITSILNKLNSSNLNKISNSLIRIVDDNNIYNICNIILAKSCIHALYMNECIELLNRLNYRDQVHQVMKEYLLSYMYSFDDGIFKLSKLDYDNYDEYCKYNIGKNMIFNHINLATKLINEHDIDIIPISIFNLLMDNLIIYTKIDQSHLEILLIEAISKYFDIYNEDSEAYIRLVSFSEEIKTTKAKFICQDIINKVKL